MAFDYNTILQQVAQKLAMFLDDVLPKENRWEACVRPHFKNRPFFLPKEEQLEKLDLSALLIVFSKNYDYFKNAGIYYTPNARFCGDLIRNIRNSIAHQSADSIISDEEHLFRLHAIKRFLMHISWKPTSQEDLEAIFQSLNKEIFHLTKRSLDSLFEEEHNETNVSEPIGSTANDNVSSPSPIPDQPHKNEQDLAYDQEDQGVEATHTPSALNEERLIQIETKLDQLLKLQTNLSAASIDKDATAEDWQQDLVVAEDPLSFLEAKSLLRSLRDELSENFPSANPASSLLRNTMVNLMLEKAIKTESDFLNSIPEPMIRDTDNYQLKEVLPKALSILRRVRNV